MDYSEIEFYKLAEKDEEFSQTNNIVQIIALR